MYHRRLLTLIFTAFIFGGCAEDELSIVAPADAEAFAQALETPGYELASFDFFRAVYVRGDDEIAFGPSAATSVRFTPNSDGASATWVVPLTSDHQAIIAMDARRQQQGQIAWQVRISHPAGLPAGTSLLRIEQRFPFRHPDATKRDADVYRIPHVYGETRYQAKDSPTHALPYMNFLVTQQVTLTNELDGLTMSVMTDDTDLHRKDMGFTTLDDGTRVLVVKHKPENLESDDYAPDYQVLLNNGIRNGLDGAIAWYRKEMESREGSFLSQRHQRGLHPLLNNSRFIVGVGGVNTKRGGDLTDSYINRILADFGAIHGDGLIFYHLGWEAAAPAATTVPEGFKTIKDGHQEFVDAARDNGFANVPYTWPGVVSMDSEHYDEAALRKHRDGKPHLSVDPEGDPTTSIGDVCHYAAWGDEVYPDVYDAVFNEFGFEGAYLDALEATRFCHDPDHDHPAGENEQHIGALRMTTMLHDIGPGSLLANETPTEGLGTDMSGMVPSKFNPKDGDELFRRTYRGDEWFGTSLTLDVRPLVYFRDVMHSIAQGIRPAIIFPEWDNVLPASVNQGGFAPLAAVLKTYVDNYDQFRVAMEGVRKAPLKRITSSMIPSSTGLAAEAVPAVLHGVFAPDFDSDERTIVLARWTNPNAASFTNMVPAPTSGPLLNTIEPTTVTLSRKDLGLKHQGVFVVTMVDPQTGVSAELGRFSDARELELTLQMPATSFMLLKVEAVSE